MRTLILSIMIVMMSGCSTIQRQRFGQALVEGSNRMRDDARMRQNSQQSPTYVCTQNGPWTNCNPQ